jgi:hypothetical protein
VAARLLVMVVLAGCHDFAALSAGGGGDGSLAGGDGGVIVSDGSGGDGGCGADLMTDVKHCGACGRDCTLLPGVDASRVKCSAGACDLAGACLTGRAHCGGPTELGCETDLSSAASCGACGKVCAAATPLCAPGPGGHQCAASCPAATPALCGGSCVNLASDPMRCGACTTVCTMPANGTALCSGGVCDFSCKAGFMKSGPACVPNAVSWVAQATGSSGSLTGLTGGSNSVYVSSSDGWLYESLSGGAFGKLQVASGTLNDVAMSSSELCIPASVGIRYYTTVTGQWTTTTSSSQLLAAWYEGLSFMVVGRGGTTMYGSIGSFQGQSSSTFNDLYDVWGARLPNGTDEIFYAVGASGTIVTGDGFGGNWSTQTSGTNATLYGVSGSSSIDVYVVGAGGTILHSVGNGVWSPQSSGVTTTLRAVWAASSSDVYAVGDGGVIRRSTGNGVWTGEASGTTQTLRAVWGPSSAKMFVAGDAGTFMHKP